jgi:hypothetical protein
MKVYKYQLTKAQQQVVMLPKDAEICTVQWQGNCAVLWALVHPEEPVEEHRISQHFTGDPIADHPGLYIATYTAPLGLVVHVYEQVDWA